MRRWMKRLVLLLSGLVLVLGAAGMIVYLRARGPEKPAEIPRGDYTYAGALAEHEIEQLMDRYHVPGVAALLIDDQAIVWEGYYGLANREAETPIRSDTIFKTWSLAKPFTAMAFMRLVEEGTVDLDAPLADYLPSFSIQSRFPEDETITLRQVLAHRAGLPRHACRFRPPWEIGPDAPEKLAQVLSDCYLAYPPGTRYKYSNVGYDALGYIVQSERESPFPLYMRDHFLRPIGMSRSAFFTTELPAGSEVAFGYEYYKGEHFPYEQLDIDAIPSGNLYATPDDLATFVRFLFREGEVDARQLIQPETLATMYEDHYSHPADPQPMGLGWKLGRVLDAELLVWHDGGPTEGTGALIAMLPERKLGVVLLANSTALEGSVSLPIAVELLEVMLETRDGISAPAAGPALEAAVDAAILAEYAGTYALLGGVMDIVVDGDRLRGSHSEMSGFTFDLVPLSDRRFRLHHWLLELGLTDLLRLPMDLGDLEVEFHQGDAPEQDVMIVNFGGLNYEMGPRFPALPAESEWGVLTGRYDLYASQPSGLPAGDPMGESEIFLENGRLFMSGVVGPIVPIDDRTLTILGGPYHGETITYDPETGNLTRRGLLLVPARRD